MGVSNSVALSLLNLQQRRDDSCAQRITIESANSVSDAVKDGVKDFF